MIHQPSHLFDFFIYSFCAAIYGLAAWAYKKFHQKKLLSASYLWALAAIFGSMAIKYLSKAFDLPHHTSTHTNVLEIVEVSVVLIALAIILPQIKRSWPEIKERWPKVHAILFSRKRSDKTPPNV